MPVFLDQQIEIDLQFVEAKMLVPYALVFALSSASRAIAHGCVSRRRGVPA